MTLRAGVGTSKARNPALAAREAVAMARAADSIERPDLVFLFATINYDHQTLVSAVREATGNARLIGCSVEGVISAEGSSEDAFSVLVALITSEDLQFFPCMATNLKAEPEAVGARIGEALRPQMSDDALALLLLPDGLTVNFDRLVSGLRGVLSPPKFLPLFGGTAGDDWAFNKTFQYFDDQVYTDSVVAALVSGSARIAFAVNHGCFALGAERKITKARGNTILEIDGRPALDVMGEYRDLDERESWSKAIVNLPLGFRSPEFMRDKDDLVIRYVAAKDDDEKSITIPTSVEAGTSVWMARRDQDKISKGNDDAAASLLAQMGGAQPKLVFQFDCAGRGKVILRDEEKQRLLQRLRQQIGPEATWFGFHAYGEIAPVGANDCFHNFTAVLATVY
jgi:hypothetical protein